MGCTALQFTCNRRSPTRNKSYSFFLQLLQVVFYYFFSLQKWKFTSATKNTCLDQKGLGWNPIEWPNLCTDPTRKHKGAHRCCPRLKSNQPSFERQQQLHRLLATEGQAPPSRLQAHLFNIAGVLLHSNLFHCAFKTKKGFYIQTRWLFKTGPVLIVRMNLAGTRRS